MASSFEFQPPVGRFTWDDSELTPAASAAVRLLSPLPAPRLLRGEADDFVLFCRLLEKGTVAVAGLTHTRATLTVRFEDVWMLLPHAMRAFSYACRVIHDPYAALGTRKDDSYVPSVSQTDSYAGLAPDVRLCVDLAAHGGFAMTFTPEKTV